jgi:hypothetical protein
MTTTPISTDASLIKAAIKILTTGRKFVATGWTQRTFYRRLAGVDAYCAIGGIRRAAGGGVHADFPGHVHDAKDPHARPYFLSEAYLRRGAARKSRKSFIASLADWNDHVKRTQDQVLDAYDLAIKRAEKDLAAVA